MSEPIVRAGGGIVWRHDPRGPVEIVLVHRPAYDDWSFSQGQAPPRLQVLVFGCAYQRIADHTCSARTLRRRRDEWIAADIHTRLHQLALAASDRIIGLDLDHLAVDGCSTKAPCGGEVAGPSPVDRGKGGGKRSLASDGAGIPLGAVTAPANRRDDGLLAATQGHPGGLGRCPSSQPCTWTPAMTTCPPGRCWPTAAWPARSPPGVGPPRSRWVAAGSSNGPMPG